MAETKYYVNVKKVNGIGKVKGKGLRAIVKYSEKIVVEIGNGFDVLDC